MAIRMITPVPGRVVQVLKDFLFAETTAIDAVEADGITTPEIPTDHYFDYDRQVIAEYPACTIRAVSSTPVEVKQNLMGSRVDARHRLEVKFHATVRQGGNLRTLEKLMQRWISAAVQVLAVLKERLQTAADPIEWGSPNFRTFVEWTDAATYGPEVDQGDGGIVRTATLPIDVRRIEAR